MSDFTARLGMLRGSMLTVARGGKRPPFAVVGHAPEHHTSEPRAGASVFVPHSGHTPDSLPVRS